MKGVEPSWREPKLNHLPRHRKYADQSDYAWANDLMEGGKRRPEGHTARSANTNEVRELRRDSITG